MHYLCANQNQAIMSDKIQYWINQNGEQSGPHTLEQLLQMTLGEQTYVWSAGFDDWKPLADVPELSQLLVPQPVEGKSLEAEPVVGQPLDEEPVMGKPVSAIEPVNQSQPSAPTGMPYPECPPTNMVWAIISTILCCIPLGIVAIVYASKVSKAYYEGNLDAARHYSEVSAWWCIAAIVGGIIMQPIVYLIQMSLIS